MSALHDKHYGIVQLVPPIIYKQYISLFFLKAVLDIILVCGSDRSIQVFDMNKGTVASEVPDAHNRAIHCVTQNKVRPC